MAAVDTEVKIIKSNGTIGSENKADVVTNWQTSDTTITYGGETDDWSETWGASDIKNSNFGVVFAGTKGTAGYEQVDHIKITVYYTEAEGTSSYSKNVSVTFGGS